MALYKLYSGGVIKSGAFIPEMAGNKDWDEYTAWLALGNTPDPADPPTAHETEAAAAPQTARAYFAAHQAAIDFIRLTPAEQETQINAMTLAQAKVVIVYLTIAVSALVKREFLS